MWAFDGPEDVDAMDAVLDGGGGIIVGGRFEREIDILGPDGAVIGHIDGVEEDDDAFLVRLAPP